MTKERREKCRYCGIMQHWGGHQRTEFSWNWKKCEQRKNL